MYRIYRNRQIEYFQKKADKSFWEKHWETHDLKEELKRDNQFIRKTLCRYNRPGDSVLEGGCGACSFLSPMYYLGFGVIGLDFAENTIKAVKRINPNLTLCIGDLTQLAFKDASFDAYWSNGVIEHFGNGYDEVLIEAKRVLKTNGTAYISFPYMNLLRKLKGVFRCYNDKVPEDMEFYQYALEHNVVRRKWEESGFTFLNQYYLFPHFKYNFLKSRVIQFFTDPWHHHSIMLIFKKKG